MVNSRTYRIQNQIIKIILILTVFLFLKNNTTLSAQTDSLKNNTVYVEYLGQPFSESSNNILTSGLLTLKYDRILLKRKKSILTANIGITYFTIYGSCENNKHTFIVTPIMIDYLFGKNRNYFGVGLVYFSFIDEYKKLSGYFSLNIEDRLYLGKNKNIFLTFNFKFIDINFGNEGCYKQGVFPVPGFGLGYSFK